MHDPGFWYGKNILLTGATGFLGGWLAQSLLQLQAKLICIVRRPKPESQFALNHLNDRVTIYHGSVEDPDLIQRILAAHRIEVLFHTAYGADVNRVLREPLECFRSAALSTWVLLEALRQQRPECLAVISSTDKVYGAQQVPFREEQRLDPRHPYEVAKASQDLAAQSYGKIYGLPVAVTRCANYFGPYDFNFTRLIPGALQQICRREPPTLRSDGQFTRDFLYIEDAVEVQLLLAERLALDSTLRGEPFNFSYGSGVLVLDLVRRLLELCGSSLQPQVNNQVAAEIRHLHLDSSKARQRLGWSPRVGFDDGLEATVRWYQRYFETAVSAAGR